MKGWLDLKYTDLKDLGQIEEVCVLLYFDIDSNITKQYVKKHKPQLYDNCRWVK